MFLSSATPSPFTFWKGSLIPYLLLSPTPSKAICPVNHSTKVVKFGAMPFTMVKGISASYFSGVYAVFSCLIYLSLRVSVGICSLASYLSRVILRDVRKVNWHTKLLFQREPLLVLLYTISCCAFAILYFLA